METEIEALTEQRKLVAEFMGHKPEVEYCVGSEIEDTISFAPKNVGNYFPDPHSQKKECERWLKEQHERYPDGWVTKGGHTVRKFEWYKAYDEDWNLLMLAVAKINDIWNTADEVLYHQIREANLSILNLNIACPIHIVFESVVKFVNWYNQTQVK